MAFEIEKSYNDNQLLGRFEAEAIPHLPLIKRIAYQIMRNPAEAEDLVQETFAQALQSFANYQPGTNCRAWLCKIMFRKRSHWYRANSRYAPLDENVQAKFYVDEATNLPPEFIGQKLSVSLRGLPVNFREVIWLCDVEELTYREAAHYLNVPIGTIMSRLFRARRLLRSTFEGQKSHIGEPPKLHIQNKSLTRQSLHA
jgi:RNA polymerase sigma-70 factor, ECF subfamily